jgi:hypothetical protein
MNVDIHVTEEQLLEMEQWLDTLPRDAVGYVRYHIKDFVWHSPGIRNGKSWLVKASVHFTEEQDASAFRLRFKTEE